MSKENYTGIDKVFERPHGGYLSAFSKGSSRSPTFLTDKLVDGLGESWRGLDGIKVKPYASMIATHSPIDCIAALQAKHPDAFATRLPSARSSSNNAKHPMLTVARKSNDHSTPSAPK